MRVVFCGSGTFAVPSLKAVARASHEIAAVITQPARPAGRRGKLRATPAADASAELGLDVIECPDINRPEMVEKIRSLDADAIFVADFGQYIRRDAREAARLGSYNLHGSVLPELRGAAPINWAIIRGYRRTGVTTFRVTAEMDAGDIFLTAETEIAPGETADELRERLAVFGAPLTVQTLDMLEAGQTKGRSQKGMIFSRAPLLKKSDGMIDWSCDAKAIENLVHGTWAWPGGQTLFCGHNDREHRVVIARAEAVPSVATEGAGVIGEDLTIATGDGCLAVREIQPAGKRLMRWRDFVNGYRVRPGDRFVTRKG